MELSRVHFEQVQIYSELIRKVPAELISERETQTDERETDSLFGRALTCPKQLRLPKVLHAWLKSSSSQLGKDETVPSMQSRLSRLRLLESSLRDGRQLERGVR